MIKPLLKKQLREIFSWILFSRKSGKKRSGASLVGTVLLYIILFGYLAGVFFLLASTICKGLVPVGYTWLYFAIMGLIALLFGILGSAFSTYSSIYLAKDNELLLSMPIPDRIILPIRLVGAWAMGTLYELIVMIPTLIAYFIHGGVGLLQALFSLLVVFFLSLLILALSALLGYFVALISTRLKNKSYISTAFSLIFIFAYYFLYSRAFNALNEFLANPSVSESTKSILFPFYHMGLAAEGNAVSMLIFALISAAVLALVYFTVEKSFLKISTRGNDYSSTRRKRTPMKASTLSAALLKKELRRFTSSSAYMLNCGLGIIFTFAGGILLLVKSRDISAFIDTLPIDASMLPLIGAAAMCMIGATSDISAPSVSLEGKHIWILKAYPIPPDEVLKAKLKFHVKMNVLPVIFTSVCFSAAVRLSLPSALLMLVCNLVYVILTGISGLVFNLIFPNLDWTNEIVPIKQGASVVLELFAPMITVTGLGFLYWALRSSISPVLYLALVTLFFALTASLLYTWLIKKGAEIFEKL